MFSRAPQERRNDDEQGALPTLRAQQEASVSRKREYKGMKFVEDINTCELRGSEIILLVLVTGKLVESRCKSLEDRAILLVGSQYKTKGSGFIFPLECFHFSFLSFLLMLSLL